MKKLIALASLTTLVFAAPYTYRSLGDRLEAGAKNCQSLQTNEMRYGIQKSLLQKCTTYSENLEKSFKLGYISDEEASDRAKALYLKHLRASKKEYQGVKLLINRENKKARQNHNIAYYKYLISLEGITLYQTDIDFMVNNPTDFPYIAQKKAMLKGDKRYPSYDELKRDLEEIELKKQREEEIKNRVEIERKRQEEEQKRKEEEELRKKQELEEKREKERQAKEERLKKAGCRDLIDHTLANNALQGRLKAKILKVQPNGFVIMNLKGEEFFLIEFAGSQGYKEEDQLDVIAKGLGRETAYVNELGQSHGLPTLKYVGVAKTMCEEGE